MQPELSALTVAMTALVLEVVRALREARRRRRGELRTRSED